MSSFDEYFVGDDKPFAENINDALLLSNVFDFTVPIVLPSMFSNQTWVNNTGKRKASVSVVGLKESLPSGVSVSTVDDASVLTGTGTVKLVLYPNFNSYGGISKIGWTTGSGTVSVKVEDKSGNTIISNVSNGGSISDSNLKPLREYVLVLSLSSAVLTGLTVTMVNTSSENRFGASVKIQSVDGLEEAISGKANSSDVSTALDGKVDKVTGKGLSTNDFTTDYKSTVDSVSTFTQSNFAIDGSSVGHYYRNKNKIIVNASPTILLNSGTHSTNIAYPPLKDFLIPCICSWETTTSGVTTTNYGIVMVTGKTGNGKLALKVTRISADTTNATVYLNFEYLYQL